MSVAAYTEYKDSGVEWLGAVPSHWQVRRLKDDCEIFASNVDKKAYDGQQDVRLCNYTDVYYNDRIVADMPFMEATATEEQITRFTLRAGDTIITKDSETADDIAISAYVPADLPGVICGYHLSVVRPGPRVDGAFIKRYFDSRFAKAHFQVRANGLTRVGLGQYALDNAAIALPPLPEQTAIASFLDREAGKIDALVEEQRRLIALLKEKRQAVISHAVTKGLDPHAPMKDSSVEWLGEVPAHWEVRAIWLMFELGRGRVLSHQDIADNEGEYPVYSSQTENDGKMGALNTYDFSGDYLTWTTDGANAGTVFQRSGKFNCTNVCGTLKAKYPQNLAYFQSALSLATGFYVRHDINPKLMNNVMASIRVPIPPEQEQAELVAYVVKSTGSFAALEQEAERGIALLQERRAALISAAVTGKIDVRGLAQPKVVAA